MMQIFAIVYPIGSVPELFPIQSIINPYDE